MSTPTAAGMMARWVAITLPTVAPLPRCTSGITATWRWTNGMRAMRSTWSRASSSNGTPAVQARIGLPSGTSITWCTGAVWFSCVVMAIGFSTRRASGRSDPDLGPSVPTYLLG
jgi:hypothetical protein